MEVKPRRHAFRSCSLHCRYSYQKTFNNIVLHSKRTM